MSEQNNYRIAWNYKKETGEWTGWKNVAWWETEANWQDAIHEWIDYAWVASEYTWVTATPSKDGKSGILEIQFDTPGDWVAGAKIRATLIED